MVEVLPLFHGLRLDQRDSRAVRLSGEVLVLLQALVRRERPDPQDLVLTTSSHILPISPELHDPYGRFVFLQFDYLLQAQVREVVIRLLGPFDFQILQRISFLVAQGQGLSLPFTQRFPLTGLLHWRNLWRIHDIGHNLKWVGIDTVRVLLFLLVDV